MSPVCPHVLCAFWRQSARVHAASLLHVGECMRVCPPSSLILLMNVFFFRFEASLRTSHMDRNSENRGKNPSLHNTNNFGHCIMYNRTLIGHFTDFKKIQLMRAMHSLTCELTGQAWPVILHYISLPTISLALLGV